jgi:hypothetical protein
MSETASDNYPIYYADKLWNLQPEVYRTLDTDQFGANGPLREMINRIGATAAELRRGIDRMWEDQSIETCDDWVIPYIADLLDTRLVLGLDARGQRLDVANTIDYRRRKGTLAVLEQIASDITSWDAKVVEFFRRLGRTRHGLDPPIGPAAAAGSTISRLRLAEGLSGPLTRTRIGGFANLRDVYGATKARTAFDEFFYTADTRVGQGVFGWYAIPHLGVFVWRLLSRVVGPVTPVAVQHCPGWFTFDPTGRDVPLFAQHRSGNQFGDNWVSPTEGQLPGPISQPLLDADIALGPVGLKLYPIDVTDLGQSALSVLSVAAMSPPQTDLVPAAALTLRPTKGRFAWHASPPMPPDLVASYCYGFPSLIGAGPYDRRGQAVVAETPAPEVTLTGGGGALTAGIPADGTITLADSLTYAGAQDIAVDHALTLRAGNEQRPLVRLDRNWIITGASAQTHLTLDGMFVSGHDIVLRGSFASVTLTCCTLDPGSAATPGVFANPNASPPAGLFMRAADGRDLVPTRLWIEAAVTTLTVDCCVLGPIRTRGGGSLETATISNSTVQGIRTSGLGAISEPEVKDPPRFLRLLQLSLDPVSAWLRHLLQSPASPPLDDLLGAPASPPLAAPELPPTVLQPLLDRLDVLLAGPSIYRPGAFAGVPLSTETRRLRGQAVHLAPAPALNRLLLEDAYPLELADAALAFGDGTLTLSRCTVLGRVAANRLDASECILHELAQADDRQDGCVRFSAWASGSVLPRQYESVSVAQSAALFTSTTFGNPGYAQLLPTADLQRLKPAAPGSVPQNTISAGAEDGSEMGAYARDRNPIRARALLLKLQEYMPAGLVPVIINVT